MTLKNISTSNKAYNLMVIFLVPFLQIHLLDFLGRSGLLNALDGTYNNMWNSFQVYYPTKVFNLEKSLSALATNNVKIFQFF